MATEQIPTSIIADDAVTSAKLDTNLSVAGTLGVTGALTASGGIANAGTITAGTLGSSVVFPADHVIQIQSVLKTSFFSATTSTYVDVTGLSASITPSSTSNKILVMCSFVISGNSASGYAQAKMLRGTDLVYVGDASASRERALLNAIGFSVDSEYMVPMSFQFLDTPSSTSSLTYKIQARQTGGNKVRIGATGNDGSSGVRSASSIILMEIKQ